ncbi:hypothetical protein [Catenuloplanes atrovinosus]|uniref:Uncharacterized protein n=1 Tax=Catenuloplanes atrovinosus TaxID=137266 RepID=A0AAE4C7Y1_9ACTN|nr:hypothetical protein [Catenuloplanes atrovinosus]MDR7274062.1 hypothetical protein [Catenuloplanes atrovinosus]
MEAFQAPVRVMSVLAAEERPWSEIPVVRGLGVIVGILFLVIAIRAMFGGGKR